MRYLFVLTILWLGCLACIGQDAEQPLVCDNAQNQTEINRGASEIAKRADVELNAIYVKLLSKISGDQDAIAKVKKAEITWIDYRDAYIEAMYPAKDKQANYGSMFPMEVDLLRARLTQEQVKALTEMLRHYSQLN